MPKADAAIIPIFIDEPTGLARPAEPILGGVPLAQGVLSQGGWFALRASDGREHVVEGTPAAWWPDGSVKWLHLCGPVDLAGGRRNEFALSLQSPPGGPPAGPGAAGSADAGALRVQTVCHTEHWRDIRVLVTGGLVDVAAADDERAALSARVGGKEMLTGPGLSGELVLAGPDGQNRRRLGLLFDDGRPEVVVQTASRVVIRLAGRFLDGPRPAGELLLFLEVLAFCPQLRLTPVFIYLGRPERDLVASLTVTLHTAFGGDDCRYGLAGQDGEGYWDAVTGPRGGPRWPQARQVQWGSSFFRTDKRIGPRGSWVKAAQGLRSDGWCHLGTPDGGATAAMRYFWQEYPRSLALDGDAGTITFGLVPPEGPVLDLRRYSPINHGMAIYETGKGLFPQDTHGAGGIAKATELMVHFHAAAREAPARFGRCFAQPARVLTAPDYFAATEVVGKLAPFRAGAAAGAEGLLAKVTQFLVAQGQRHGWYGLMDFGDLMESYDVDRRRWAFDLGGYAWVNSEALPDYGLWLAALRTGRSDWLEAAIAMSRHNRDVDCYHRGEIEGAGTRHHVNHWGDYDKEWRVSMPLVRRLHYYLTADPWTAEAIRRTVGLYQSYRRRLASFPSMTGVLAGVYALWEMTGEPAHERTIRRMLDAFADAATPQGPFASPMRADLATGAARVTNHRPNVYESFFLTTFGGQHVLVELAELLGHRRLSEAIVRNAEYFLAGPDTRDGVLEVRNRRFSTFTVLVFLAHAWRATGRQVFADAIADALARTDVDLDDLRPYGRTDWPFISVWPSHEGRNKVTCELGSILHLAPYGLAALAKDP